MDCCGNPVVETTMALSFATLFGFGLTMSLGHCLGMCGPLVTAVSAAQRGDGASSAVMLGRLSLYNLGRIAGYAGLGAVGGLLGSAVSRAGQGVLSIAIGALMLLTAVGLVSMRRWEQGGPLQKLIADRLPRLLGARTAPGRLVLGLANGLLPCGPVYKAAMTAAASGSVVDGGLAMVWFGLGTVPVLLLFGMGVARLGLGARRLFNRLGAALVFVMAVQLILRGLAARDVIAHARLGEVVFW
jgi:sulfite exporter TauE/SafE